VIIQISKNDVALIRDLADYRMMTCSQLALLHSRNEAALRRRMKKLLAVGMVEELPVGQNQSPGRPVSTFGVGRDGVGLLRERKVLPDAVSFEQVTGTVIIPQASHQMLMNWCRIHLVHMTRKIPRLSIEFLTCNSPFALDPARGTSVLWDRVPGTDDEHDEGRKILPDAVFTITHTKEGKTLLFFLEVDMNTEPVASSRKNTADITGKIGDYQGYFRSGAYKRYQETWATSLNGFRLLFLCNNPNRMASLCETVRSFPPSDFIWLTSQERMFVEGMSGDIWVRGGKLESGVQSILGRLSERAPIPSICEA